MATRTERYTFTEAEVNRIGEAVDADTAEQALRRWIHHQYPINNGVYVIGDVTVNAGGSAGIEIVERGGGPR